MCLTYLEAYQKWTFSATTPQDWQAHKHWPLRIMLQNHPRLLPSDSGVGDRFLFFVLCHKGCCSPSGTMALGYPTPFVSSIGTSTSEDASVGVPVSDVLRDASICLKPPSCRRTAGIALFRTICSRLRFRVETEKFRRSSRCTLAFDNFAIRVMLSASVLT